MEVTIHTLLHLKCIRLVSVRSSLPCINVRRANRTDLFILSVRLRTINEKVSFHYDNFATLEST